MTKKQKAILLMLLSTFSFSVMQLIVKLSSGSIPTMEQVFARNFVTMVYPIFAIIKTKTPAFGKKENWFALFLRAILGYIGVVGYFYATNHMNVADASLLHRSSPFFTILFAAVFLKDKLKKPHIAALLIAFIGTVLVINPSLDIEKAWPAIVGLISAITAGGAYVAINYLKGKENNNTIIFTFSLLSCVLSAAFGWSDFIMPNGLDWLMLAGIGISAAVGQITLTQAYKMTAPGEVSIINYLGIIFSAVFGIVFLDESIGTRSLIGMIMIFAAALLLYFDKNSSEAKSKQSGN